MFEEDFRAFETEMTFSMLLDDTDIAMEGSGSTRTSNLWTRFVEFIKRLVNKLRMWFAKKRGNIMVHKKGINILLSEINKINSIDSVPYRPELENFIDVKTLSDTESYFRSRNLEHYSEYRKISRTEEAAICDNIAKIPQSKFALEDDKMCEILMNAVTLLTSFFNAIKWDLSTVVDKDKEVKLDEPVEIDMDDIESPELFGGI